MSVRPVTAYVQPHGLVLYRDHDACDLARDDEIAPTVWDRDAPERHLNLQTSPGDPSTPATRSAQPTERPDHDAPGGETSLPPLGAVVPSSEPNTR